MTESGKGGFNPWPWVAPVILTIVLFANVLLIYLALGGEDPLPSEAVISGPAE